jgi:hypothetical protein
VLLAINTPIFLSPSPAHFEVVETVFTKAAMAGRGRGGTQARKLLPGKGERKREIHVR